MHMMLRYDLICLTLSNYKDMKAHFYDHSLRHGAHSVLLFDLGYPLDGIGRSGSSPGFHVGSGDEASRGGGHEIAVPAFFRASLG
jgi:hypothetical protein